MSRQRSSAGAAGGGWGERPRGFPHPSQPQSAAGAAGGRTAPSCLKQIVLDFFKLNLLHTGILPSGVPIGINTWLILETAGSSSHFSILREANRGRHLSGICLRVFMIDGYRWQEMKENVLIPIGSTIIIVLTAIGNYVIKGPASWNDRNSRGDTAVLLETYGGDIQRHEKEMEIVRVPNNGHRDLNPEPALLLEFQKMTHESLLNTFPNIQMIPSDALPTRLRPSTINDCTDVRESVVRGEFYYDGNGKFVTILEERRLLEYFYISPSELQTCDGLTPSIDAYPVLIIQRTGTLPNGERFEAQPELQFVPQSTKPTKVDDGWGAA